ncbi:MAG: hypothetical protein ACTSPG_07835 [Candidatus Hodarchaeales archaeon]
MWEIMTSNNNPEKLELDKSFIPAEQFIEKHPIQAEFTLKKECDKWVNKISI